jgi:hypothetical protein
MTSLPADEQIRFCFSVAEMLETAFHYIARVENQPSDELDIEVMYLENKKTQKEDNKMKRFVIPEHFKTYGVPLEDVIKNLPSRLITRA